MENSKRNKTFDYMRAIGAILVIVGHAVPYKILGNFIYSFHMPLFFFVSGFVYKKKTIMQTIIKKGRYLIIPYLVSRLLIVKTR